MCRTPTPNESERNMPNTTTQTLLALGFDAYLASEPGNADKREMLGNLWDFHNAANASAESAAKEALNATIARIVATVSSVLNAAYASKVA